MNNRPSNLLFAAFAVLIAAVAAASAIAAGVRILLAGMS